VAGALVDSPVFAQKSEVASTARSKRQATDERLVIGWVANIRHTEVFISITTQDKSHFSVAQARSSFD
jgi:hypothetical protein